MDPIALGCIALAAVLHAAWNILLKTAGDPLWSAAVGLATSSVVLVPLVAAGWLVAGQPAIPPEAWLVGGVSGVAEVAYFVFLSAAYRRGDLSVVYPLARGSAPVLAIAFGVVLLGERLAPGAWAGVALLVAGLLLVQRPWRLLGAAGASDDRPAAAFALATGAMIATYSAVDRVGVQLVPAWLYLGIIWPIGAAGLLAVVGLRSRVSARAVATAPGVAGTLAVSMDPPAVEPAPPMAMDPPAVPTDPLDLPPESPPDPRPDPPPDRARAVAGGLFMLAGYGLVLAALSRAPLSIVAPLRESAVVLVSAWGALRLGEGSRGRDAAGRIAGSVLILAGTAALAVAR